MAADDAAAESDDKKMQDDTTTNYAVNVSDYSHLTTYEFGEKALLRPDIEAIRLNLPELVALPRWVLWKATWTETKKGWKYNKVPINPHKLRNAKSNDPQTWGTFERAVSAYRKNQKKYAGVGFMFPPLKKDAPKAKKDKPPETDAERQERERINALADVMLLERLNGWDFDSAINDGKVDERFVEYVERLNSYTEISPSGTGLRVFVRAELPPHDNKDSTGIETYVEGRFLTVTGLSLHTPSRPLADRQDVVTALHTEVFAARNAKKAKPETKRKPAATKPAQQRETPAVTLDDGRLLEIAFRAKNGANVQALYSGDFSAYGSASEADLALCHHLAFYGGGDADQVDRLFRNSGLYRDKWDELRGAETYGAMTIAKAIDGCDGQFYTAGKPQQSAETPTLDDAEQVIGELAGMDVQAIFEPRVISALATAKAESPGLYAVAKAKLKKRGITRDVEQAVKNHRSTLRLVTSDDAGETTAGQIFADAPVAGLVIPANYQLTPEALIYSTVDEESSQVRKVVVCNAPVLLTGRTVDIDSGTEGVRVSWKRGGAGWRHRIVDRGVMADSRRIVALADQGFPVTSNNSKEVIRYADAFEALNFQRLPESKTTSHLGWQGRERDAGFLIGRTLIQPDGTTADATMSDTELAAAPIAFRTAIQGADEILSGYHSAGTLDAWRAAVNKLAGLPFPVITLFASFASPLLEILGCPNFIVSLDGVTSQGKTTAQRIAASVWGDPDEARPGSTVRTWDSTTVNFERVAGLLRNLPIVLDDTKRVKRLAEIAGFLYSLAQGKGRGRGTVGGLAHTQTWRTVLISSGEAPITSFTEDGGVKMRVLSLWGAPFKTGAALVDQLNLAVNFNFGHAGPAFISAILRRRDEWPEWRARYEDFARDYTTRANTEKASRLAKYAAAVRLAGELAIETLGLDFEKTADPFAECWTEIAGQADDAAGAERALELAYGWAVMNETKFYGRHLIETRELRAAHENDMPHSLRKFDRPVVPAGGWAGRWDGAEDWSTLEFAPHILHKLLQDTGFSPLAIIGEWAEKKILEVPANHRKFKKLVRLSGDSVYLYVIDRAQIKKLLGEK